MSYYLSITNSIFERKVSQVFYFRGLSVFLLKNREDIYLFDLPSVMVETPVARVIDYIKKNNISEAEILLPDFDEPLIDLTFDCVAEYLDENDASIGLLVEDEEFINQYRHLIEKYRITFAKNRGALSRKTKRNVSHGLSPELENTYGVSRSPRSSSENDVDVCGPSSSIIRVKKSPKPKKKKEAENKTGLEMDKPFVDILISFLNESGKNNVDVYTKGGITRQVFSKILCNRDSVPKKDTVICLVIGLELPFEKAKILINSAGYALSRSIVFDSVVIKYLKKGIFDLNTINDELESRQCALLGWKPRED